MCMVAQVILQLYFTVVFSSECMQEIFKRYKKTIIVIAYNILPDKKPPLL